MMDTYMEYMLKRKKDTKDILIIAGVIAAGVILTTTMIILIFALAYALAGSQISSFAFSVGFVLIALVWYGAYLLIGMRNIEYEYILTNSEVDMDRITSRRGRKRIVSFDFANAEICANIEDAAHNGKYKNPEPGLKVIDMTGDKTRGGVYFVDYYDDEKAEKRRVLFQPTSKMIEAIKRFNPRNVFIYE
ncbi:MAG: hypothetical protein ACI4C7_06185 [Clostridia bacterium]